jgi:hypothetical protein
MSRFYGEVLLNEQGHVRARFVLKTERYRVCTARGLKFGQGSEHTRAHTHTRLFETSYPIANRFSTELVQTRQRNVVVLAITYLVLTGNDTRFCARSIIKNRKRIGFSHSLRSKPTWITIVRVSQSSNRYRTVYRLIFFLFFHYGIRLCWSFEILICGFQHTVRGIRFI